MDDDSYANFGSNEYSIDVYGENAGASVAPRYSEEQAYRGATAYSEENQFQNEYNVYGRVGGYLQNDILGELGTGEADIDMRDPVPRFRSFTKIVAQDMTKQGIISLQRRDIQYILDQIQYISHVKYKNPTAYVLGFWVARDGSIDKKKFQKLSLSLSNLDYPIKQPDVIRYANMWIQLGLLDLQED